MSQSPPLTVHHLHISQSERIVFLCEELSIPYELKTYTRAPIFSPSDLAALTPQKSAPVITTKNPVTGVEFNMSESGAIAEYINTIYGDGKLALKPDHENYADYLFWFHYSNASLGPSLSRVMLTTMLDPAGTNPMGQAIAAGAHKHLSAANAQLEKTGAYLAGKDFTLADVMTMWNLTTGRQWNQVDFSGYPAILAYLERVSKREAYQRAMEKAEPGIDWKVALTGKGPEMFGPYREMLSKMGVDSSKL
ncbi:hypothetical protein H2200_007977 [Cladophialophora chaetospira]|uniref:Glutathione S-transferase n=1 Tax=Cladophialophora chaetospira TaxID=386627 RepID=A0AA38X7A4_9EURO|nr:hypothetical protein H2200_007977 [Cladophialophora chaetospira]